MNNCKSKYAIRCMFIIFFQFILADEEPEKEDDFYVGESCYQGSSPSAISLHFQSAAYYSGFISGYLIKNHGRLKKPTVACRAAVAQVGYSGL